MAKLDEGRLSALQALSKDELIERVMKMEEKEEASGSELLRQVQSEAHRRENVLFMKLTSKEQEVQEYLSQLEELRTSLGSGLRNALLDPVVNAIFQKMKEEMNSSKAKLDEAQQEALAWKFTPDSTTGKRLMGKCRNLIQENEELGKIIDTGRLARLEGELALSRKQASDFKSGQTEMENLLVELDEDMDGLQATVMYLQKQLEDARRENDRLSQILRHSHSAQPPSQNSPPQHREEEEEEEERREKCGNGRISSPTEPVSLASPSTPSLEENAPSPPPASRPRAGGKKRAHDSTHKQQAHNSSPHGRHQSPQSRQLHSNDPADQSEKSVRTEDDVLAKSDDGRISSQSGGGGGKGGRKGKKGRKSKTAAANKGPVRNGSRTQCEAVPPEAEPGGGGDTVAEEAVEEAEAPRTRTGRRGLRNGATGEISPPPRKIPRTHRGGESCGSPRSPSGPAAEDSSPRSPQNPENGAPSSSPSSGILIMNKDVYSDRPPGDDGARGDLQEPVSPAEMDASDASNTNTRTPDAVSARSGTPQAPEPVENGTATESPSPQY